MPITHTFLSYRLVNLKSSRQAVSKVRFLTDTMMNGEKASKMFGQDPACQCGFPMEHRIHQLLDCSNYSDLRDFCILNMTELIISKHRNFISKEMIIQRNAMAHLILDPSWFRVDVGSTGKGLPCILNKDTADQLECMGRTFCYQLYRRRLELHSQVDTDSDTDTDEDDKYSLHDTSESSSSDSEYSF